jgi:hypothetical protein
MNGISGKRKKHSLSENSCRTETSSLHSSLRTPSAGPQRNRGQHSAPSFLRYQSWHISGANGTSSTSASYLHLILVVESGALTLRLSTNDFSSSQGGILRIEISRGVRGLSMFSRSASMQWRIFAYASKIGGIRWDTKVPVHPSFLYFVSSLRPQRIQSKALSSGCGCMNE